MAKKNDDKKVDFDLVQELENVPPFMKKGFGQLCLELKVKSKAEFDKLLKEYRGV